MGGKRRIFGLAALLLVLLAVPLVFGSGIADVPKFSFGNPSSAVESASSTASVFVDPDKILKDYLLDPGIGDNFTIHVNVSDVSDLFTWQVNMVWNSSILNVSRIIPGEFLARADNQTSSEELGGVVINSTDNAQGYGSFAETILGNTTGITGNGTLVSIEFLIVGIGWTDLNISITGTLPTVLLDSAGGNITYTEADGYFKNMILSDIRGSGGGSPDGEVDIWDFSFIGLAYGKTSADPDWNDYKIADIRGVGGGPPDGEVDIWDFSYCGLQYGQSI